MKKALLYLVLFAAIQILTSIASMVIVKFIFPSLDPSSAVVLNWTSIASNIIAVALFLGFRWCPVSRNWVRERQWLSFLWTILLALGLILPLTWVMEQLPKSWTVNDIPQMEEMVKTTSGYFAIAMLAPLAEEIVFRGAIIRALLNWRDNRWLAIIISALFFSAIHMNPAQMPSAFVIGCLLGWIFVRTNSIALCCILHWINNSSAYVIANMFPTLPMDTPLVTYFGGNEIAVYQAVICSLMIALPSLYQLNRTLKK